VNETLPVKGEQLEFKPHHNPALCFLQQETLPSVISTGSFQD